MFPAPSLPLFPPAPLDLSLPGASTRRVDDAAAGSGAAALGQAQSMGLCEDHKVAQGRGLECGQEAHPAPAPRDGPAGAHTQAQAAPDRHLDRLPRAGKTPGPRMDLGLRA